MTNIWRRGPVLANPYHANAFRALGITRDIVARAEIDQKVAERRQAVNHVPGYYILRANPLTQADITSARQTFFDPTRRILEELLEHQPERPEVSELTALGARLQPPDWPEDAPLRNLSFLLRAVQQLALDYARRLPPVAVPAFPVDLRPIPPGGRHPEDQDD